MKQITIVLAVAALISVTALLMVDREDAMAANHIQGCASLTWEDWTSYVDTDHIDEYDPAVVTPTNYLMIDETRHLVWFAGKAHGRDGFTACLPADQPPTPTPTHTATPTAIATPVLIGCRWPNGFGHDFSAPISPSYDRCLDRGGQLEYEN